MKVDAVDVKIMKVDTVTVSWSGIEKDSLMSNEKIPFLG